MTCAVVCERAFALLQVRPPLTYTRVSEHMHDIVAFIAKVRRFTLYGFAMGG
jgi:hypothetical protein